MFNGNTRNKAIIRRTQCRLLVYPLASAHDRPMVGARGGPPINNNVSNPLIRNLELFRIDRYRALPQPPSPWRIWRRLAVSIACLLLLLTGAIIGTMAGILAKGNQSQSGVIPTSNQASPKILPLTPRRIQVPSPCLSHPVTSIPPLSADTTAPTPAVLSVVVTVPAASGSSVTIPP
ncbi:hypothetical protein BD779DRAFT_906279 [Infundibulicybe gibba]|nr:hypothetical protein BD779DRAFT_906279 [Infundibulicybe gibba]